MRGQRSGRRLLDAVRVANPDIDAAAAIAGGEVVVDGIPVTNPASVVRPGARVEHRIAAPLRGETKLRSALDIFAVDVSGRTALDVGASTGGFTAALLTAGADRVHAVDVGHGQLLGRLRQDPRVVNLEGVNVSELRRERFPGAVDLVTVDVSYLALSSAVAQLTDRVPLAPGAVLVGLVKPMFEMRLGTAPTEAGAVWPAVARAARGAIETGWTVRGAALSPVRGAGGAAEGWLVATWAG